MDTIFDTKHLYRTYFKMALPVVLGLVVTLIYNLADTFFIAQTKDTALIAGVSVCSPVFTTLMAFGNIYGQGGSSLISRLLGQNNLEGTKRVSSFCFYIAIATGVVLAILMMAFCSLSWVQIVTQSPMQETIPVCLPSAHRLLFLASFIPIWFAVRGLPLSL